MRVALVALIVLAVLVLAAVARPGADRAPTGRRTGRADRTPPGGGWRLEGDRVRLDLEAPDPLPPALVRLAEEAAVAVLTSDATRHAVEVVDRVGRTLARVDRALPAASVPEDGGPHPAPTTDPLDPPGTSGTAGTPDPLGDAGAPEPGRPAMSRSLAASVGLDEAVRARGGDPDRAADVVAAVLARAGRPVEVRGDVVVSGSAAVAIADVRSDAPAALSRAYLRLTSTGATGGIVLVVGFADPAEVRRRDALTPTVRYVGIDALRRMADAAEAGLDPLAFATPPRTPA